MADRTACGWVRLTLHTLSTWHYARAAYRAASLLWLLLCLLPGDGFHNYIIPTFVSCYHNSIIPKDRTIREARLRMRVNRVFGFNPFTNGTDVRVTMDMVRQTHTVAGPGSRRRCFS
jgi:hypothetical protein